VGMIALYGAGYVPVPDKRSAAPSRLANVHAVDEVLAHVHFHFQRIHIDNGADTSAREAAARGTWRDDFAFCVTFTVMTPSKGARTVMSSCCAAATCTCACAIPSCAA